MGLRQDILNAPVTELEWRQLLQIHGDKPVRAAIQLMREKRLGCVVVIGDDGRPLGKFTERDLIRLLLLSPESVDQPVGRSMSGTWGVVKSTDTIGKVIDLMDEMKLRFVIVVDDAGKPIGLTGQKGVMEYIVDHFPRQVKVQMMESKLFMDQREGG
jgi:CBS domain-containing protein